MTTYLYILLLILITIFVIAIMIGIADLITGFAITHYLEDLFKRNR